MKKIEIEIPEGKIAKQETKDGSILITFENEWDMFSEKNTYEDFVAHAPSNVFRECLIYDTDTPDIIAYKKLKLIIKVINGDWTPDFKNANQKKWYAWFKVLPSGFDFSNTHYYCDDSSTDVGSRLCFESKEKCEYVAKQFIKLYEQLLK